MTPLSSTSDSSQYFAGTIVVASRIVDQLSSGLYEGPAACLKELVNNSYDADATLVSVFVKPDADQVIVEDNGVGMNKLEFVRHFSRISESYKRDESDTTARGRKKIGKIGIGFIAANELCDTMEIFSTKKGSTELLHVEVRFDLMRKDPAERRKNGGDYDKGDFEGEVLTADSDKQYTQVILKRVRAPARLLFAGDPKPGSIAEFRTLYGKNMKSMAGELSDPRLASWTEFDTYSQNLLRVALNVPIAYFDNWMPSTVSKKASVFASRVKKLNFKLEYDGAEVRKPVILRPHTGKGCFVSEFRFKGKHVAATGYFYAQHGTIQPNDLHGLLLRVRGAAIDKYDPSFLGFPPKDGSVIQRWISAEVWGDDRLEEVLNIDRRTLRIATPAYLELRDAIHAHLRTVIARARHRLYEAQNVKRKELKASGALQSVNKVITESLEGVDRDLAAHLVRSWKRVAHEAKGTPKSLLRRYDVAELYEIVMEVAAEILDARDLKQFARRLTERLAR